jgi:hypothetical protein
VKATVTEHVDIDAPPQQVWDDVFDWPRQGEWIPSTRVTVVDSDAAPAGRGVGARIEAWTGIGRFGVLDTMTVTRWEVLEVCEVEHTGRVIRGSGTFRIAALPDQRSRFHWREDLEIPLGRFGYLGFRAMRPAFMFGVRRALRTLKHQIERDRSGI